MSNMAVGSDAEEDPCAGGLRVQNTRSYAVLLPKQENLLKLYLLAEQYVNNYRGEKISLYVVARMMQASSGRSGKQQQEQTSPNHVQRNFLSSVYAI